MRFRISLPKNNAATIAPSKIVRGPGINWTQLRLTKLEHWRFLPRVFESSGRSSSTREKTNMRLTRVLCKSVQITMAKNWEQKSVGGEIIVTIKKYIYRNLKLERDWHKLIVVDRVSWILLANKTTTKCCCSPPLRLSFTPYRKNTNGSLA